jgi:hypothetical protein
MIHSLDRIDRVLGNQNVLFDRDRLHELIDVIFGELIEPDTDELVLQRLVDLTDIIADEAESYVIQRGLE